MIDKESPSVIWPDRPKRLKQPVVFATAAQPRLLVTSAHQKFPVLERIQLPSDSVRVEQLQLKYKEYQKRVAYWEAFTTNDGFASESEESRGTALIRLGSERFKVEILGTLFAKRVIYLDDFIVDLRQPPFKTPEAALEVFNISWRVIRNYCEKGGEGLEFGTGLPKLSLIKKIKNLLK